MRIEEANQSGAMALFNEKYADVVRVLSVGTFSKELCGGTHVQRCGDIGLFKITAEYGVASGVRRIEFVTGQAALIWVNQQLTQLDELAKMLKTSPYSAVDKLAQCLHDSKQQEKALHRAQQALQTQSSQALLQAAETHGQLTLLIKQLGEQNMGELRKILDQLKSALTDAVIVLFAIHGDKINVIAGVSPALLDRGVPDAATLVRLLCGKGGGRDDMAQGGGELPEDLSNKLEQIKAMVLAKA